MSEVKLIDLMGNDDRVADAARVSFAKEARSFSKERNAALIHYLANHGHWTPFAHPQATFYIKAPLYVARQLFKSRVGFNGDDEGWADRVENEISRRYVDRTPEFEEAGVWHERPIGAKQGAGKPFFPPEGEKLTEVYDAAITTALDAYETLIAAGVAPEEARRVLPEATMTEWYWTGSLAAWARLCALRTAPDAQRATREVCDAISDLLRSSFPVCWPALSK